MLHLKISESKFLIFRCLSKKSSLIRVLRSTYSTFYSTKAPYNANLDKISQTAVFRRKSQKSKLKNAFIKNEFSYENSPNFAHTLNPIRHRNANKSMYGDLLPSSSSWNTHVPSFHIFQHLPHLMT